MDRRRSGPGGRYLAPYIPSVAEAIAGERPDPVGVVATRQSAGRAGTRNVGREPSSFPAPALGPFQIGRATLYADHGARRLDAEDPMYAGAQPLAEIKAPVGAGEGPRGSYGRLTSALMQALKGADLDGLIYTEWAAGAKKEMGGDVLFAGANRDERVLANATVVGEITKTLAAAEAGQFKPLTGLLASLIERRPDLAAESYIDLGIAEAITGDYAKAIKHLDLALKRADPERKAIVIEAHYYLGRMLFESRSDLNRVDLNRAVSELDFVVAADPRNPRARYYRGQAVRAIIEENLRDKAFDDFRVYLKEGAPLGRRGEVEQYLSTPNDQPGRP